MSLSSSERVSEPGDCGEDPTQRRASRRSRPLVLIVEENEAVRQLLMQSLQPEYATLCAEDGPEALNLAIRHVPDLVISALLLPGMGGEAFVQELRAASALVDVPVLVVTAVTDAARLTRLLEGPVQDVVRKPFDDGEVRARVGNLLAEKRARDLLNDAIGKHESDLVRLAERVAAQEAALRKSHQVAELANRTKASFLQTMSHELRTPITAMEIQMKILQRNPSSVSSTKAQVGLARLGRSTKRLRWLVDTVVGWADIQGGRCELDVSSIDVRDLLSGVMEELEDFSALRRVQLVCEAGKGVQLSSDQRLVRLVVLNLMSRAIQDASGDRVVVTAEQTADEVRIGVRDGGGRPFDAGAGSGLDLHIVLDIARAVHGDIRPERGGQAGDQYVVTLPQLLRGRTTATYSRDSEEP